MAWVETVVKQDYASGQLRQSGGGDADICTKPDRQTRVELAVNDIRMDDVGNTILMDVYYSVREMRTNNTFLTWNGTAHLPLPEDARRHTMVIQDARTYNHSWILVGKHHDWMELGNMDGTVVERGWYKIDGPGDDLDNAGVRLSLRVKIKYFEEE